MNKILERFAKKARSWFSRMIIFILLEVMNVGAKPEVLSLLADFVERTSQIEKEKRSSLRLYSFMPYIGVIISILTIISMLEIFTNEESTLMMSEQDKNIILLGSIIQAFATGMVAGKMGEENVSAGFKHSLLLTVVSLLLIAIAPSMIGMFGLSV